MVKMVDKIFIDTNILLYATIVTSPFNRIARHKLQDLQNAQIELWINRQVIREYMANISKMNPIVPKVVTYAHLTDFQGLIEDFIIANENEPITQELFNLLKQIPCGGKQVHDANIIATMQANAIKRILTHNVADFTRFGAFIEIEPLLTPESD